MREFKTHPNTITDRSKETVAMYLREISRMERITVEEEADLARAIRRGGPDATEARDRLIKANLRFVVTVANQYKSQSLELADLISEGNIGLIKAAEMFDDTRGFKFISYAVWWIRQSIMSALVNNSSVMRLPSNQHKILRQFQQLQQDILQKEERQLTVDEFCEVSGYDYNQVARVIESSIRPMCMDERMSDDSDTTFGEMMASESACDSNLEKESLKEEIMNLFEQLLSSREAYVLKHLYGIGCAPASLDEISENLNLSRERTRQISIAAIRKIRHSVYALRLAEFLAA